MFLASLIIFCSNGSTGRSVPIEALPFVKMICRFVPEWFAGVIECHQLALLAVLANLTAERYSREGEMILYSSSGSTRPSPVLCVCGKTLWHRTANHSGKGHVLLLAQSGLWSRLSRKL